MLSSQGGGVDLASATPATLDLSHLCFVEQYARWKMDRVKTSPDSNNIRNIHLLDQ